METFDYSIIGGGIVGLAAARQVSLQFPGSKILVLEKEDSPGQHQTGRNSGVIHSGIYYQPGSFKARFARAGAESMVRFCKEFGIPFEVCGKLIVATRSRQIPQLEELLFRAGENGVPARKVSSEEAKEFEPHVECLSAVRVESTGITSYREVCLEYLRQIEEAGGLACFNQSVVGFHRKNGEKSSTIETQEKNFRSRFVINCAGLHSDRIARASGLELNSQIIPFRGEYFQLRAEKQHLVRSLIYPVPNPDFPFLGVHFTRMIDGSVHAGPNAVLAFAREGYSKTSLSLQDTWQTMKFRGFQKLALKHFKDGSKEIFRSLCKPVFTRSLQELVPEVRQDDLEPCESGIRAQGVDTLGNLIDDFLILETEHSLHVCNAPSPAATASLEIGKEIGRRLPDLRPRSINSNSSQIDS